jgi:hypothetical protein
VSRAICEWASGSRWEPILTGRSGPINTIAVHPQGKAYASGAEDGFIRVHWVGWNVYAQGDKLTCSLTTRTSEAGLSEISSQKSRFRVGGMGEWVHWVDEGEGPRYRSMMHQHDMESERSLDSASLRREDDKTTDEKVCRQSTSYTLS